MKQRYIEKSFRQASLDLIDAMNAVLANYEAQGYTLTVRQLFYQLVTTNTIENTERQYKKVGALCRDARLTGLMDWDMIEDRTRSFVEKPHWTSGAAILQASADGYREDMWKHQGARVFCIIEKDALRGILEPVCNELDIPLMAARGYPSVSIMHSTAEDRIIPNAGQYIIVLHLGDHDPSGLDMTDDIVKRLDLFSGRSAEVIRIALNMAQIEELKPPKNWAKLTDTRANDYIKKFGPSSWELDALSPDYLVQLVRSNAERFIDWDEWGKTLERIKATKTKLKETADQWQQGAQQ